MGRDAPRLVLCFDNTRVLKKHSASDGAEKGSAMKKNIDSSTRTMPVLLAARQQLIEGFEIE